MNWGGGLNPQPHGNSHTEHHQNYRDSFSTFVTGKKFSTDFIGGRDCHPITE